MKRNPIAKALRSPHLAPKSFKPKKGRGAYDRKIVNVDGPLG